jgi:superfamily II DNA or RNA helicase
VSRSVHEETPTRRAGAEPPAGPDDDLEPFPEDPAQVAAWAARNGVRDVLSASAWTLPRAALSAALASRHSIGSLFATLALVQKTRAPTLEELTRLCEEARKKLVETARPRVRALRARAAFLARRARPTEAALETIVARLERAVASCPPAVDEQNVYPLVDVRFDEPPRLRIARSDEAWVELDLRTRDAMPVASSGLQSWRLETQLRPWLLAAIDALSDPESPVRAAILAYVDAPAWQHALWSYQRALPPPAELAAGEHERLAFRVRPAERSILVEVALQTAGKRGYSAGKRLDAVEAQRSARTPLERELVRRIDQQDDEDHDLYELTELLAKHPRVHWVGTAKSRELRPVRFRRPRVAVYLEPQDDERVAVRFELDRERIEPSELVRCLGAERDLVLADERRGTIALARLDAGVAALARALADHPTSFPIDAANELLSSLVARAPTTELVAAADLSVEDVPADPRPLVRVEMLADGRMHLEVLARPLEHGPAFVPGSGPDAVWALGAGKRQRARRALGEELEAARALVGRLDPARQHRHAHDAGLFGLDVQDPDEAVEVLLRLASEGAGVVVEGSPGTRVVGKASVDRLRVRVKKARGWFTVDGEVSIGDEHVALLELLEAARAGRRFVRLESGAILSLADDLVGTLERIDAELGRDGAELRAGIASIDALLEAESLGVALDVDRAFRALVTRLERARGYEPALPAGLEASLRPYQLEGFRWLARIAEMGAGACLADEMGLGKTVQTIALLLHRKELGPALVVAPTSVVANWAAELARFAPSLSVHVLRGKGRGERWKSLAAGDVALTSYDILTRDEEALSGRSFATLVLDEAHAVKNALAKRTLLVHKLEADVRIALTGTPLENHLGELWSLYRAVFPELLGSWESFRERFADRIERERDPATLARLARVVRPFLLRRTKAEVLAELPPRIELVRRVELSGDERGLYEAARRKVLDDLAASASRDKRFEALAGLLRLRQLACHPRLAFPDSTTPSSKLTSLVELCAELRESGHRALVFSQFTSHLALVRPELERRGYRLEQLDGSTPAERRGELVARFQRGELDLFLVSLKAGGTGLNLTAADTVIHLDPWWNPAAEDQASDRAHRIGQTRTVTVVRLIATATIEERVLALHQDKRELAASILEGTESAARLSVDELVDLLREPVDVEGPPSTS